MFKLRECSRVLPETTLERYQSIAPATLGHHLDGGVMDNSLKPVRSGTSMVGVAVTVQTFGRDSTVCHKAIDVVKSGDVIVIDRGGDYRYACWGEMTSLAALLRGVAGVVVDGAVTDVEAIREMGLPVFCRGTSALTTQLLGHGGGLNIPVNCGGVVVQPGDLILGDDDGIVVLSPAEADYWLQIASEEEAGDAAYRQALKEGKLPSQLAPIDELIRSAQKGSGQL